MFDFAKEMYFDVKAPDNKSTRDRTPMKLLKSPAIFASGVSTVFLPENPNELCDRIKLLLQEKQAGNNSYLIDIEIVAIVGELTEYKCISTKQHKILRFKCLNSVKIMKLVEGC